MASELEDRMRSVNEAEGETRWRDSLRIGLPPGVMDKVEGRATEGLGGLGKFILRFRAPVGFILIAISLFMILLVLIQRGRGGGLAGAFGGMGGQSAFGTRAGDMFTRITIVLAVVWVLLAGGLGMMMRRDAEATRTGKDEGGFQQGADADKKNDTEKSLQDSLKSDAATDAKADVKAAADDVAPSETKSSEAADTKKSDAESPDAKTTDTKKTEPSEAEKSAPAEKSDAPVAAEPAKESPADPAPPAEETPAVEPQP